MKLIERTFERNPLKKGKITSSIGYLYGECARKLYYSCNENREGFTQSDIDAMNEGTKAHHDIQNSIYPDYLNEIHFERDIPNINGISKIGATIDLFLDDIVIEIKPKYSRKAYYQTLIEKFVLPYSQIRMYAYWQKKEFQLKASYTMAVVYIGRIITALKQKPPRPPFVEYSKAPCNKCLFRERCYREEPRLDIYSDTVDENRKQWKTWKSFTDEPIRILQENDKIEKAKLN